MNIFTKTVVVAVGAAYLMAVPAVANADRVYFLVGTRHIYRLGHNQYDHVNERKLIEQDYADQVAYDQDQYDQAIQSGTSPDEAGPQFNQDLADLAAQRDSKLGALYENVDYERVRHPELQIEGDGPYQVMAITFHWRGDFEVFDNFYVYAPWPGYVVVGHPYGWNYGVVYQPTVFVNLYLGWHTHYIAAGRPVFSGGYGRQGAIHIYMRSNQGGGIYRAAGGGRQATHVRGGGLPNGGRGSFGYKGSSGINGTRPPVPGVHSGHTSPMTPGSLPAGSKYSGTHSSQGSLRSGSFLSPSNSGSNRGSNYTDSRISKTPPPSRGPSTSIYNNGSSRPVDNSHNPLGSSSKSKLDPSDHKGKGRD